MVHHYVWDRWGRRGLRDEVSMANFLRQGDVSLVRGRIIVLCQYNNNYFNKSLML